MDVSTFNTDTHIMAYQEGRRDIVQQMLSILREDELLSEEQRVIKLLTEEEN